MVNRIPLAVPTHLSASHTHKRKTEKAKDQSMSAADLNMSELADAADKSRQKSCNACVRSKRRCDKRTPRCTRCAEKNFSCVYQNLPPVSAAAATASSYDTSPAEGVGSGQDGPLQAMDIEESGSGGSTGGIPSFDFNTLDNDHLLRQHHLPTPASSSYLDSGLPTMLVTDDMDDSSNAPPSSSLNINLDATTTSFDFNSVMDFLNADPVTGAEIQLWETPLPHPVPKTTAPEVSQLTMFAENLGDMCGGFQPWHVHEPSSRIGHLVTFVKNVHVTFAQTKATPFLHRHLYRSPRETPRPLIAAYTAIAAYSSRTDVNKDWAFRAMYEGGAEILRIAKEAPTSLTGHEKLAVAQALWLLQAVRCFDGDVALRAQGERDMGVLLKWLKEVEVLRDNLDDLSLLDEPTLRSRSPKTWEVWVFNECVRRTVLMGHIFTSMYEMLKSASEVEPDVSNWLVPHRWTFSKHLWDAPSSPAFYLAWREKPLFVVNSFFVQEAAKVAKPADVDDLARVFLAMNYGVEETKHFMLEV